MHLHAYNQINIFRPSVCIDQSIDADRRTDGGSDDRSIQPSISYECVGASNECRVFWKYSNFSLAAQGNDIYVNQVPHVKLYELFLSSRKYGRLATSHIHSELLYIHQDYLKAFRRSSWPSPGVPGKRSIKSVNNQPTLQRKCYLGEF